jgi:hypothetical protein
MNDITQEIEELRKLAIPDLIARYREVFGKDPRVKHREWLWKRIAWRVQEVRFGGLSEVAKRRLEELIAEIDLGLDKARTVTGVLRMPTTKPAPAPGTTITREWRGRRIEVRVVEGGFQWEGIRYRSLSAVAKAVTGTHWNGRLFFGLAPARSKEAKA